MKIVNNELVFSSDFCLRCGHLKSYHKMIVDGKIYIPCIRKKPYKFADHTDVKLGMRAWHINRFDPNIKPITGFVRSVSSFGYITLWKLPEDTEVKTYHCDNGTSVAIPWNQTHEGSFLANFSCYSSLENAEAAREKLILLDEWRKRKYGNI